MSFLSSAAPKLAPWKVLLVDDEPDIHDITKLTLTRFRLDGRALSFVHAYSGAEAKEILARKLLPWAAISTSSPAFRRGAISESQ